MEDTSRSGSVIVMTLQTPSSRSISPMTPSPSRDLRGVRLFRVIGRKLGRRSQENISEYNCEDDSRSSSTDSCSSTSAGRCSRTKNQTSKSEYRSESPNHISSSSSDTGSESNKETRHRHHSTTAASFRKVFESLTLNARSHSCTGTSSKDSKRRSKKSTPKRILRAPVTYTYVRGISGLPTQRIPRTSQRVFVSQNGCCCNQQFFACNR